MDPHHTQEEYLDEYYDDAQYGVNNTTYSQSQYDDMPEYYEDEMYDRGECFSDEIVNSSPCPPQRYIPRQPQPNFGQQQQFRYPQFQAAGPQGQSQYTQPQRSAFQTQPSRTQYMPMQMHSHFQSERGPFSRLTTYQQQQQDPYSQYQAQPPPSNFPGRQPQSYRAREDSPVEDSYPAGGGRIKLVPVTQLPDMYRALFKFGVFNAVQSSCYDTLLKSTENMIVSAPTGSGKTVLFELAIIKMLLQAKETGPSLKAVYVAPTKALCSERYRDWAAKFDPLGIKCCELTGDTVHFGKGVWGDAKSASIIVTTGEKWDSLTRNWSDHTQILSLIQLFLVDEVHILNEPRGSTLEVVVSRMKLRGSSVRFVVVSATVPNIEDIAAWIGSNTRLESSARVYQFGEEFRPCKLTRHVISVNRPKGQNDFAFARTLDNHLFGALQKHAAGKPILVFVSTRKGVFTTAEQLVKDYNDAQQKKKPLPWNRPAKIDRVFNDKRLADLAAYGIGVHHAGMTVEDRRAVEELYMNKVLRIVVATSTLAVGVNLPAHTVVIRGVHTFQNNAVVEYSDLDVMQMLGRAGRPQFDKEGVAVIICESELEHKYRTLAQGKTIVESSLHNNLPEHLNSEIGLGTINDISSAKGWLKSSFLYQRLQKNPRHYSLNKEEDQSWEERIDDIVTQSVDSLRESELIAAVDQASPNVLHSTEYGDIMSKFYIRQATMRSILAIPEHVSMRTMLETISAAEELTESKLRSSERSAYNNLRRHNDIRFEVKKLEHTRDKVFILIQAILGGISLSNPEYKSGDSQVHLEAFSVFRHLPRIARAVVEVAITRKRGAQLKHGLELLRCFAAKAWEDRPVVLRQLDSIGEKSIKILAEHGIVSIETLRKQDALRLEMLLNRKPPYGHTLLAAARELPSYSLKIVENDVTSYGGRAAVDVSLKISCGLLEETSGSSKVKKQKTSWLSKMTAVVTLTSDLEYIDFRRIPTKALKEQKTFDLDVILEKPSQSVIVYITSEAYAGVTVSNSYKPNIPASEYPTRVTKPPSLMDIELEGLEDCPELFNMDDIDANGDPIELPPKPVAVKDLTKKNTSSKEKETNPISPEPEKLPNGNYRCNHPCKDKTACRHMCCRDGLPKPPAKSSKSHASSSKPNPPGSSSATVTSNASRPRPVPVKPNKKPIVKTDRTLQDLEDWHKNTNVETNLKLPEGHRLKLESLPRTHATPLTRKKLPTPDFNIQFSQIKEDFEDSYMTRELAELSDEELPEAADILAPTAGRAHKRKRSSDYDDEEMDSLIRTLPDEDAWGITSPVKENRGMKRPKKTPEQKMDRSKTPLFLPSPTSVTRANTWKEQDDDDEVEIVSPPRYSVREPPTSTADDFDDYTLDPQFFDITPPTPDLEMSTHSSEDEPSLEFEAQPTTGTTTKVDDAYGTSEQPMQNEEMDEPMKDYMEEEFAMLEAWLNSSAVEIVPN